MVEAFYSNVPLVVLTADRPHELRDFGASQTIDQVRLYGGHVKWFVDLPEPEESAELVRYARAIAGRAAATAQSSPGWAGSPQLAVPRTSRAHSGVSSRWSRASGRAIVPIRRWSRDWSRRTQISWSPCPSK